MSPIEFVCKIMLKKSEFFINILVGTYKENISYEQVTVMILPHSFLRLIGLGVENLISNMLYL